MKDGVNLTSNMRKSKNVGLSRTTFITLLGMLAVTLLSLSSTIRFQRRLIQNDQENGNFQRTIPSILSDLLHLYEKLPNATSPNSLPPFREVTYAIPRQKEVPPSSITLSTQLTVSRLPHLVQLLVRWGGPISCAVHLPDPSAIHALYEFVQAQDNIFHDHVTFHVMLEKPTPYYDYPINRMRNLALLNIDTEHFFLCNVDSLPPKDALGHLLPFLSTHSNVNEKFKKLYVLPAFEVVFGEGDKNNSTVTTTTTTSLDEEVQVPHDKNELLSMLRTGKLQPFHNTDNYLYSQTEEGHTTTTPMDYDKWYDKCPQNESYPIEYHETFEPYVVGNKYGIPVFDVRLRAFGYNKASWVAEAHLLGYQFEVLCDHFVVHWNNPGQKEREVGEHSQVIDWYQRMYLPLRHNVTIVQELSEVSNNRKLVYYSIPRRRKRRRRKRTMKRMNKRKK